MVSTEKNLKIIRLKLKSTMTGIAVPVRNTLKNKGRRKRKISHMLKVQKLQKLMEKSQQQSLKQQQLLQNLRQQQLQKARNLLRRKNQCKKLNLKKLMKLMMKS